MEHIQVLILNGSLNRKPLQNYGLKDFNNLLHNLVMEELLMVDNNNNKLDKRLKEVLQREMVKVELQRKRQLKHQKLSKRKHITI